MTIHTKYATYVFQGAFNSQDIECYLCTKTHDKLMEHGGKGENSMPIGKTFECMAVRVRRTTLGDQAMLFLNDRVVSTSPVLSTLGLPQGRTL